MTSSQPAAAVKHKSAWVIWPIGLATAFSLMGDATLYSVLPTHYADAGIGLTSVGLILSVNRFIRLLTNGPVGWFFDRLPNQRFLFICSLALGVFSTILYAVTSGVRNPGTQYLFNLSEEHRPSFLLPNCQANRPLSLLLFKIVV